MFYAIQKAIMEIKFIGKPLKLVRDNQNRLDHQILLIFPKKTRIKESQEEHHTQIL